MLYSAAVWALTQQEEQILLRSCRQQDVLLLVRMVRMGWFGHVYRSKDSPLALIGEVVAPGRRPRGKPKKRWQDCVRVREDSAGNRAERRAIIGRLTSS